MPLRHLPAADTGHYILRQGYTRFFNILTPYPGTRAFEDIGIKDLDRITNWEDFVAIGPKVSVGVGTMSKKELLEAIGRAYKKFYIRPIQLIKILFQDYVTIDDTEVYYTGTSTFYFYNNVTELAYSLQANLDRFTSKH